ncbi:pantoate--beta-alanine ligase [Thalassovita taeanensis]|uniref:Pantothenate synthetase n=1 Tax=Thalassovita taeanensis TaxID=657014 RepID=A0A1H9GFY5_9RHOB|nr:pantoate--beta-alanine ligase [Thalassovita taeanensis]SEQ49001.1 pantothenate synthetase [Thalassovita taeanensis]
MKICRSIQECRATTAALRATGKTIGFVPTMGFLHDGHLSLITKAQAECDAVIVSIFVNPTQFGQTADLDQYPRDEPRDLALLTSVNVAAVFLPEATEVYPPGNETIVETTRMANILHGKIRPGHFRGVASVVARLFNIVQPDVAVFGEKDYQQLQVIKRMVQDLHMPVRILGGPTVREADGLAMSSRNVRLSPEDRAAATILNRALCAAEASATHPGATVGDLRDIITATIAAEPRATLEGLDTVAADTLTELSGRLAGPVAVMISVAFGDILLIDQKVVQA